MSELLAKNMYHYPVKLAEFLWQINWMDLDYQENKFLFLIDMILGIPDVVAKFP